MAEILTSKITPFSSCESTRSPQEVFLDELSKSSKVFISVGYVTAQSLDELNQLVHSARHLTEIIVVLGMYRNSEIPEKVYRKAKEIDKQWREEGIGQIRFPIPAITDHEKIYLFYGTEAQIDSNDKCLRSAIIGSQNLSFIKPVGATLRQYETAVFMSKELGDQTDSLIKHEETLMKYSNAFSEVKLTIVREPNTALQYVEGIRGETDSEVSIYRKNTKGPGFLIELKVPVAQFRFSKKDNNNQSTYTASNINVCYAEPRRSKTTGKYKPRDWYEMQLHVPADIRKEPGYPERNHPFFVITDDGYLFKAQTESDSNKQLSAVGNEHIMGRWLKGRLAAAGLVEPVDDPYSKDPNRKSMITKEMLDEYGTRKILLLKTDQKRLDENGEALDVWYLTFNPEEVKKYEQTGEV